MQILEHIHINVASLEATKQFLQLAVPEYGLRGQGQDKNYGAWLHIGSDSNYIALTEVEGAQAPKDLRHIGFVVDDIHALMARMQAAGHQPSDASALDGHPYRRRVYYRDANGLYWEFVEYLSKDARQRNDYSQ